MKRSKAMLAGAVAVLVVAGTAAWAHMEPGEGRLVPYEGFLDKDGVVAEGPYDFRFALFESAFDGGTDPASCLGAVALADCASAVPPPAWAEEQTGVTVRAGAFGVTLGSKAELHDTVLARPDLYLTIATRQAGTADPFVVLQGRQRILAAPFAARAATAKDYTVTGNLTVVGSLTVGPALVNADGGGLIPTIDPAGNAVFSSVTVGTGATSRTLKSIYECTTGTFTASNFHRYHAFTAAECGGVAPTGRCMSMLSSLWGCDKPNVSILGPGEPYSAASGLSFTPPNGGFVILNSSNVATSCVSGFVRIVYICDS
ncbi:MAG TPA: hypothetical protein VGK67_14250 [Myxococcales bacterium]|jgi:hypothetical protein